MASTREFCVCAICKDDISTTLGRRRILFHFSEGKDPVTKVVQEFATMFQAFTGRKCEFTTKKLNAASIDSFAAKWSCRKCERQINSIYKRFEEVYQFYDQFRECPLANLLTDLSPPDDNVKLIVNADFQIEENQLFAKAENVEIIPPIITDNQEQESVDQESQLRLVGLQKSNQETAVVETPSEPEVKVASSPKKAKGSVKRKRNSNANEKSKDQKNSSSEEENNEHPNKKGAPSNLSPVDQRIIESVHNKFYEGVLRNMLTDDQARSIALIEVARFISRELAAAGTEVAKMSHVLANLTLPNFKKFVSASCPNAIQFFSAITGKDRILSPPIISIIAVFVYVLNSHANLFQKMISTILLHAKCNPATIEKLHTYKLCVAYETLVTFLDNNTELGQVPKLVRSFQLQ